MLFGSLTVSSLPLVPIHQRNELLLTSNTGDHRSQYESMNMMKFLAPFSLLSIALRTRRLDFP